MLLRNYDNIMAVRNLPIKDGSLYYEPNASSVFGDGSLFVKNVGGYIQGIRVPGSMFSKFNKYENNYLNISDTEAGDCSLKWSDSVEEPTYDEYTVNFPSTSTAVSITKSNPVYKDGYYESTVTAIYKANEPLTVGSIVVVVASAFNSSQSYPTSNVKGVEVYRKVLDTPIEVPTNANFVLTFTTKVSANPNKPASYDASAAAVE